MSMFSKNTVPKESTNTHSEPLPSQTMEVRESAKVSEELSASREVADSARVPGKMQNFSGVRDTREPLWIFGYGSLCWNPGFEYQQSVTGFVKGFSRRFWQGNTTHRGTETKPGRVATLVEDKDGITWGRAFLVAAEDTAALPYLAGRECRLGGYRACTVSFHPRLAGDTARPAAASASTPQADRAGDAGATTRAVLYVAVPDNKLWLGAAPLPDIARQIIECRGPCGPNAEYLLRLAAFMREEAPEALDDHLFSLERLVRKFAAEMRLCARTLMGERAEEREQSPKPERPSYQHASRVPEKKLRCVNM